MSSVALPVTMPARNVGEPRADGGLCLPACAPSQPGALPAATACGVFVLGQSAGLPSLPPPTAPPDCVWSHRPCPRRYSSANNAIVSLTTTGIARGDSCCVTSTTAGHCATGLACGTEAGLANKCGCPSTHTWCEATGKCVLTTGVALNGDCCEAGNCAPNSGRITTCNTVGENKQCQCSGEQALARHSALD